MHTLYLDQQRPLIPDAATAAARAFAHDSLFLWLRPHGAPPGIPVDPPLSSISIPLSFEDTTWFQQLRTYFLFRLRESISLPHVCVLVVVTDLSDAWWTGTQQVMGHSVWNRGWVSKSSSVEETRRREEVWGGDSLFKMVERAGVGWEKWYWDTMKVDKAYDLERLGIFEGAWDEFGEITRRTLVKGLEGKNGEGTGNGHVWLQFLGVDPKFQRKGVGGLLMRWGMETARREGVPVGLTASPQGLSLYMKWGFEEVGLNLQYAGMEDVFMVAWAKDG
ncbi:MAG: hypothetical protein MMC23_002343 [Stictis urceolatum]|nr:hypothetical protein [Stictis urceolata]